MSTCLRAGRHMQAGYPLMRFAVAPSLGPPLTTSYGLRAGRMPALPTLSDLPDLVNPATQSIEIGPVGRSCGCGADAFEEQDTQALSIPIPADEPVPIFAASAETSLGNPFVHIGLEYVGKGMFIVLIREPVAAVPRGSSDQGLQPRTVVRQPDRQRQSGRPWPRHQHRAGTPPGYTRSDRPATNIAPHSGHTAAA